MALDEEVLRVLIDIREASQQTNQRLDQTNQRLDQTNQRLDLVTSELGRRVEETNRQLASLETEMIKQNAAVVQRLDRLEMSLLPVAPSVERVIGIVRETNQLMRDQIDLRGRVERCERDIDELRRRVG
jgi:hypothetical protein